MKIDVILNHKKFQPEVEGMQFPPESYRINITRSDGMGISKIEAQTLEPETVLSRNDGFGARELREVIAIATEHRAFFAEKWHEYFA